MPPKTQPPSQQTPQDRPVKRDRDGGHVMSRAEHEELLNQLNLEVVNRNGAIEGCGIGGDEPIMVDLLVHQASDMQKINIEALSTAESAARDRIVRANQGIAQARQIRASRAPLIERKDRLVRSMQSILTPPRSLGDRVTTAALEPFVPCIDVLYTALEQHLTGVFDDDAVFAECFPSVEDGQRDLMRDAFARLLKECMLQNIDMRVVPRALTQILWNNDPLQMMVSASGSIVAILFAKDALLLFANSVLGVMTFGFLDVNRLTDLCFWVYNNCTLVNIQNLLVYFSVSPAAAQQFISAIHQYNREQRQYIIMSIYLLGLNAVQNGVDLDAIMGRLQQGRPVDVANDVNPPDDVAANPQVAAVNLQGAGAGAAAAAHPVAAAHPDTLAALLLQTGTDIVSVIRQIYLYAWSRGLRMTASCLREVLTVYVRRQPQDQGLAFNLVNLASTVSRWGVGLLQGASAQLDPAMPNQEVLRLMLTAMDIDVEDNYNADKIEVSIWNFTQMLKNKSIEILRDRRRADQCVYLSEENAPGCLNALRRHFLHTDMGVQRGQVNMEQFQTACLGMGLFVFEQDKNQDFIVENYGRDVPFHESLEAQTSISQGRNEVEKDLDEELDRYTKKSISRAVTLSRKFATIQYGVLGNMARAARVDDEPAAHPLRVQLEEVQGNRIRSITKQIMSGIEYKIRNSALTQEQKAQIISDLIPIVKRIDERGLVAYLVEARPTDPPPATFIESCQAVLNSPLPASVVDAQDAVRAAVCNGFYRCAASLTNFAVVSSNSIVTNAVSGLRCVSNIFGRIFERAVPNANPVVPNANPVDPNANPVVPNANPVVPNANPVVPNANRQDAAEVIDANITIVTNELKRPDAEVVDEEVKVPRNSGQGGGRSRSRKRSASKRTRRKAKQPSKKLKRKSRRYVRRRRSTRRKN